MENNTLKEWKIGDTSISLTEEKEFKPNYIERVGVYGQTETKVYYINIKKREDFEEWAGNTEWYETKERRKYKSKNSAMNQIRKLLKQYNIEC